MTKIYANFNFDMLGLDELRTVRLRRRRFGQPSRPVLPARRRSRQMFTEYFADAGSREEPTDVQRALRLRPVHRRRHPGRRTVQRGRGPEDAEQAAIYGGTAGEPYDRCYHQACDTVNNLNTSALSEIGDGAAHAVWTLAKSKTGFFDDQSLRARKAIKGKTDGPLAVR